MKVFKEIIERYLDCPKCGCHEFNLGQFGQGPKSCYKCGWVDPEKSRVVEAEGADR